MTDGYTKRANSVNALRHHAPFEGVRAAAETFYARYNQPAVFRLTPLAGPEADAELEAQGYLHADPSRVMVSPLTPRDAPEELHVEAEPSAAWLDGFAQANAVDPGKRPAHDALIGSIRLPSGFATLHVDGVPSAFGLAVVEQATVGLFDLVVAPPMRRRGLGRTMVLGLMAWARSLGASRAYLQVRDVNVGALALYRSLGFTDAYPYHYRIAPARAG
jgi:ribosomal protein S18 acetylase RimI-like enzyme